jgi:hypothetical protein
MSSRGLKEDAKINISLFYICHSSPNSEEYFSNSLFPRTDLTVWDLLQVQLSVSV